MKLEELITLFQFNDNQKFEKLSVSVELNVSLISPLLYKSNKSFTSPLQAEVIDENNNCKS